MTLDLRLQRAFDRVELVSGVGDPNRGTMCLMSFVAYLAGEGHTDYPSCASPLIRSFVIPVNDHMPRGVRQRLKPFAPRIIGTSDGLDRARAEALRRALAEEILPRAFGQLASPPAMQIGQTGRFRRFWTGLRRRQLLHRIGRLLEGAGSGGHRSSYEVELASAAGHLLGLCAQGGPDAGEADWYWAQAIGLLDRLCDVGPPKRQGASGVRAERLTRLEAPL
jgi:hypothetical protein